MEPFDDFVRDVRSRLVGLAYSLSGDRAIAEDIVQDALLATHLAWDDVQVPHAYARRAVVNLAASRVRGIGRERRALARVFSRRTPFAELAPPDAEFWRTVGALPLRQRQVIALHYVDDLAVADIATALEISTGTVKSTLHDARRSLAASLRLSDREEAP